MSKLHDQPALADDPRSTCTACGATVVHAEGIERDYAVWCTNAKCVHHEGEDVYDCECPAWAHGKGGQDTPATPTEDA